MTTQKMKHPRALVPLTVCYSLFMAAFGGILASLTLYQTTQLHMKTDAAYGVFAAAMALLWILPLVGGYLAGKWGYLLVSRVGIFVCALGMAAFCFNNVTVLYLGLALFLVGNALATPGIWCLVDYCYGKDSILRESGFTLFYLFFNLGAVLGIFVGGYLAGKWGFKIEFATDAACLLLSYAVLRYYGNRIAIHEGRSIAPQVTWPLKKIKGVVVLSVVAGTLITTLLLDYYQVNNALTLVLMAVMVVIFLRNALKIQNSQQRNYLIAFVLLAIISVIFWILYSLEPSFLSVFISTNVDTTFLGMKLPASSFFAFDGVFVILIGLMLSRVWTYLSMKNKNPSVSLKFTASLIIIGLGFIYLAWMILFHKNALMPAHDIVIAYAIFATAELLVSPIGIAMVGNLSPEGQEGLMMGFWQLSSGVGGVLAGYIAVMPPLPQTAVALSASNPIYFKTFLWVGISSVLAGALVVMGIRRLNRLMEHSIRPGEQG